METAVDKSRLGAASWDPRLPDRFWVKTRIEDRGYKTPCIIWTGSRTPLGYGRFSWQGKPVYAYRFAYGVLVDEIPAGLVIDHLCRNPSCVNVEHLDPVTHKVNILRGVGSGARNAVKTHCKRGHEFTPENTKVTKDGRACRACREGPDEEWNAQRREQRTAARGGRPSRRAGTHCYNGHLLAEAGVYVDPRGRRYCRICFTARNKRRYDNKKKRDASVAAT